MPRRLFTSRGVGFDPRLDAVAHSVGYQACFGKDRTASEVAELVRPYDSFSAALLATRLERWLGPSIEHLERDRQRSCGRMLWGQAKSEDVFARAERAPTGIPQKVDVVIFHRRSILNALKVCFMAGNSGGLPIPRGLFGDVLLMMNDVIDADLRPHSDKSHTHEALDHIFVANSLLNAEVYPSDVVGRAAASLWGADPELPPSAEYLSLVSTAVGAPALEHLGQCVDVLARLAIRMPHRGQFIPSDLVDHYSAAAETTEAALGGSISRWVTSPEELADACRAEFTLEDLRSFDILPFERKPIIRRGSEVACPSIDLFASAMTRGVDLAVLGSLGGDERAREAFLKSRGEAFEAYAVRLLRRAFTPARVLSGNELKAGRPRGKSADALVLYPDAAIAFEWKSNLISRAVRLGQDSGAAEQLRARCVDNAAAQLASTITRVCNGELGALGVQAPIGGVFPVLVTRELTLPAAAVERLWDRPAVARLAEAARGKQLQVFDIGDLELAERLVHAGHSLVDLLQEKLRSPTTASISFRNFAFEKRVHPHRLGERDYLSASTRWALGLATRLGGRST